MTKPTLEELLKDGTVGPALQRYLRGKVESLVARRELLDGTINHVTALGMVDDIEAHAFEAIRALLPEPAEPPHLEVRSPVGEEAR